jgi:hypothetical protein
MSKKEWMMAGLVAFAVATMTGTLIAPPLIWAGDTAVTIPALPPAQLTIPGINAKVTATATSDPGKPVKVTLAATVPADGKTNAVPVTVIVEKTTMSPMMRSIPMPKVIAQASTSIAIDSGGTGSAVVDLPLTWASAQPAAASTSPTADQVMAVRTTYSMTLSAGDGTVSGMQMIGNVQGADASALQALMVN